MSRAPAPASSSDFLPEDQDAQLLGEVIARLVEERRRKGLTLRAVEVRTGYNSGHLSRAERGLVQPGFILLCRWCRALDLDFIEVCRAARKQP